VPDPLVPLPRSVSIADLPACVTGGHAIPLGLTGADPASDVARIELPPGERLLVVGPDGSGRSSTLALIAAGTMRRGARLIATGPPRSALRDHPVTAGCWVDVAVLDADTIDADMRTDADTTHDEEAMAPVVVVVDDAELIEESPAVAALLGSKAAVVAAAHPDRLRTSYGHWAASLTAGRHGLALAPRPHDGELWSTTLPQGRRSSWPPGRGYLLDHGRPRLVQVLLP
jgi:S-DNA-T family DNA segregation ATPase FtsK/SpoIIIE